MSNYSSLLEISAKWTSKSTNNFKVGIKWNANKNKREKEAKRSRREEVWEVDSISVALISSRRTKGERKIHLLTMLKVDFEINLTAFFFLFLASSN